MNRIEKNELAALAKLDAVESSTNKWWRANCPFCPLALGKTDRKRALAIHADYGFYSCWRCGTKGKMDGTEEVPDEPKEEKPLEAMEPPEGFCLMGEEPGLSARGAADARAYLASRGLTVDMIRQAQIGACLSGPYLGKVVVPIFDEPGERWLGWVGRTWFKKAPDPYRYPPGMPRGVVLYNHAAMHVETDRPCLIVEGVFDALALWPDGVALLGKQSEWQVQAMLAARRPVAVVLDGDAWEEGWALAMRLRMDGQRAGSVKLPPRMDPDDMPRPWIEEQALASIDAAP